MVDPLFLPHINQQVRFSTSRRHRAFGGKSISSRRVAGDSCPSNGRRGSEAVSRASQSHESVLPRQLSSAGFQLSWSCDVSIVYSSMIPSRSRVRKTLECKILVHFHENVFIKNKTCKSIRRDVLNYSVSILISMLMVHLVFLKR